MWLGASLMLSIFFPCSLYLFLHYNITWRYVFFWFYVFGVLRDTCTWIIISFSAFGDFSPIQFWMYFQCTHLACIDSSCPKSVSHKIGAIVVSHRSCMVCLHFVFFFIFSKCFSSSNLFQSLIFYCQNDPVYLTGFQMSSYFNH
jgi:hypothetical protein